MAVVQSRVTVGTSATLLASGPALGKQPGEDFSNYKFTLKNLTGTASVFLGGSDVTTSGGTGGLQWDAADGPGYFELEPGETLYGIVASVSQVVHVLKGGR
jgi:hypothetical protein